MTVTFLFLRLLFELVPGYHQLQNGVEQIGGLGQQGVDVPFPFDTLQKKKQVGGLVKQFGGDLAQAKSGVAKIGVLFGRAVKSVQAPQDV